MDNKKIVIAGVGGYMGANVLPAISSMSDVSVYALSSKEHRQENRFSNVTFLKLSMEDYHRTSQIISDICDVAVNFSWIGARGLYQNEDEVQKANEQNSISLLESLIDVGCKRFIQIGSMAEYGIVEGLITEESECHPITPYAKRKLSCAERMRNICESNNVDFIEFRMGSIYGHYMDERNIIGYLCRELAHGHQVLMKTSCEQDWEYTHVDDVAELLTMAITSDVPVGIYNITNGETRKFKDFIRMIEEKYKSQGNVKYGNIDQGIGCQNIRCDISKIKETFKKDEFIHFDDGIDSVIYALQQK